MSRILAIVLTNGASSIDACSYTAINDALANIAGVEVHFQTAEELATNIAAAEELAAEELAACIAASIATDVAADIAADIAANINTSTNLNICVMSQDAYNALKTTLNSHSGSITILFDTTDDLKSIITNHDTDITDRLHVRNNEYFHTEDQCKMITDVEYDTLLDTIQEHNFSYEQSIETTVDTFLNSINDEEEEEDYI